MSTKNLLLWIFVYIPLISLGIGVVAFILLDMLDNGGSTGVNPNNNT